MTEIIGAEYVESKGNTHYYNYSPVSELWIFNDLQNI